MKVIKGFVTIEQYISNVPNVTAVLGELSTWSSSYAKDKGYYTDTVLNGFGFTSFKNVDTTTNLISEITSTQVKEIFTLVKSCMDYSSLNIRPHNPSDFKYTIQNNLSNFITNLAFGALVDNGVVALPEWISWTSITGNGDTIKIWLSDVSFSNQYDDYEITVVPPVSRLDDLFGLHSLVVKNIDSRDFSESMDIIQEAKNNKPETYLRSFTYDIINPLNVEQIHPTNWTVIIYGKAGDSIDTIKDEIVNYVLLNSSHSKKDWETLLPELFKRTEFVIMPRWDKISIPNLTVLSSLYSSILKPSECLTFCKNNLSFYTDEHLTDSITILPYDYKAITLLAFAGPTNTDDKKELSVLFPDYIPESSMTVDFGRMQVNTRDWVLLLGELLLAAETASEYTSVSSHLRKLRRDNILFVSALYNNINYMVAAKSNSFYNAV